MARTKIPVQPKNTLIIQSNIKRVPNPQPRDQSPVRSPERQSMTLVIVTAGDHASSMQVCLNSSIIPQEVEVAITGESLIHIEDNILRPSEMPVAERTAIARFLKSIGFVSESVPYGDDITPYKEIVAEVSKQAGTGLTDLSSQTRIRVDRTWNFVSESRAKGAVSPYELECVGQYLVTDESDAVTSFVKKYGADLPGIKKLVKPSPRDESPHKTMVVVTARDQEHSLQVYLDSNIIPQKVENALSGGRDRQVIMVEAELADPTSPGFTADEKNCLLGFLHSIGFEPTDFKYPDTLPFNSKEPYSALSSYFEKPMPYYPKVHRSIENQASTQLTDAAFETKITVDRVWNFTSEARSFEQITRSELKAFGKYLTDEDPLTVDDRKDWTRKFGSKLPNGVSKPGLEFTDEVMQKLGEHLCFYMDPVKKANWIKQWAKPGIDLSKD